MENLIDQVKRGEHPGCITIGNNVRRNVKTLQSNTKTMDQRVRATINEDEKMNQVLAELKAELDCKPKTETASKAGN